MGVVYSYCNSLAETYTINKARYVVGGNVEAT